MPLPVFAPPVEPIRDGYGDAETAAVNRAQFEGGYAQRSAKGPNNVGRELALQFLCDDDQRAAIIGFLRARRGAEAFTWQSPWDAAAQVWTCEAWQSQPAGTRGSRTVWRLSATFRREFDPV